MQRIEIIDVALEVPDEVTVSRLDTRDCREALKLVGAGILGILKQLELKARARNYQVEARHHGLYSHKPHQFTFARLTRVFELIVKFDDEDPLPRAHVEDHRISLRGVQIVLPGRAIEPGVVRHGKGSRVWQAEWDVLEVTAQELVNEVVRQLEQMGMSLRSAFGPALGGLPTWSADVSGGGALVQVRATAKEDRARLMLVIIQEQE